MNTSTSSTQPLIDPAHYQQAAEGSEPEILSKIYQENTNIAIWQRSLSTKLAEAAKAVLLSNPLLQISVAVTPQNVEATLVETLGSTDFSDILIKDIARLVDMFCYLFETKHAGLRLAVLDRAMCPRFHVDRVPCRLMTTYQGVASEWLPDSAADRSKLGFGNKGQPDEQSGIYQNTSDIRHLNQGDVALLKGKLWEENEEGGLIHRSPQLPSETRRLLLTLDFIND